VLHDVRINPDLLGGEAAAVYGEVYAVDVGGGGGGEEGGGGGDFGRIGEAAGGDGLLFFAFDGVGGFSSVGRPFLNE